MIGKTKQKIKIDRAKFQKFQTLWESLNYKATIRYDIDTQELIQKSVNRINEHFEIVGQDIIIQTHKEVENLDRQSRSTQTVTVANSSVFTLYEFITSLANATKLSMQTIVTILSSIEVEKFERIKSNENLRHLPVLMLSAHPGAAATISDYGADGFISKPFNARGFISGIKTYLELGRM